jgi:general secretion pathway protein A
MYNPYFNFSCYPFENTLDQQFLFLSEGHEEVIASLLYFIQEKKSFALVCGDVGTGKTMIIHHLLGRLPRSVELILIPYPDVEYIEILRYIARVLKINPEGRGSLDLTDDIKAALTKASHDSRQVVLIVDEAHLLSIDSLEHIRLLSNIEMTENKLLQILLIGQNELSHKLHLREMRQLLQRINVNQFLSPMSRSETIEYIDYRLRVAGSDFDRCFDSECKKLIYKMTGGVPRSINRLCDTALLICMSEKGDKVTGRVLKKAHGTLQKNVIPAPKGSNYRRLFSKLALAGGALVLLLAVGFLGYNANLGENLKGWIHGPDSPRAVNTHVQKPLPPVSEVKSEEISKPPEAEEKNAPTSIPGPATPQAPGVAQESPKVLPKEGDSTQNKDESVLKASTASPSIEGPGPNRAGPGETQAKDLVPDGNRESAQAQGRDDEREIAAKGENPNADAQNPQTRENVLKPSDVFTVTVKKGETLSQVAARWFPEDPESGQKSILSANPEIGNKNRILKGQLLRIPRPKETDPEKQ